MMFSLRLLLTIDQQAGCESPSYIYNSKRFESRIRASSFRAKQVAGNH